jgi:DNA-binding transcriptional ArsR family regulator
MQRSLVTVVYTPEEARLARYAKALAHPVRIQILHFLGSQSCCFTGQLTDEIAMAQSTISQHLKELKDAGLIQGEVMPPRVKYCINKAAWEEARILFADLFEH